MNSIEINNLAFITRYAIKCKEIDKLKLCIITLTKDNFLEVNEVYKNNSKSLDGTGNNIIHDIIIMHSCKTNCNNGNEETDYYSALQELLLHIVNLKDVDLELDSRSKLGYTALEHAFFCATDDDQKKIVKILLDAGADPYVVNNTDKSKSFEFLVKNSEDEELIGFLQRPINKRRINNCSCYLDRDIPLVILGLSILISSSCFLAYFSFDSHKQSSKIFLIAGVTGLLTGILIVGAIAADVLKNSCKSPIDEPLLPNTTNKVINASNLRDRINIMESML